MKIILNRLHLIVASHYSAVLLGLCSLDVLLFIGLGIVTFGSWIEFQEVLQSPMSTETPLENRNLLFRIFVPACLIIFLFELQILDYLR